MDTDIEPTSMFAKKAEDLTVAEELKLGGLVFVITIATPLLGLLGLGLYEQHKAKKAARKKSQTVVPGRCTQIIDVN